MTAPHTQCQPEAAALRQHTETPWELVEATEHHGAYIVSAWGRDICDLYAMSNPLAASVRNGGDSYPVHFDNADANAAFIVEAVNSHAALKSRVEELTKALRRLAIVQRHMMAYGGGTVHVGYACKVCEAGWDKDRPELHHKGCVISLEDRK